MIYSKLKQGLVDSGNNKLILPLMANKSKINEIRFYWKLILEPMVDFLTSYDLFKWADIHYILHRYVNSYAGTLLWTTITMLYISLLAIIVCTYYVYDLNDSVFISMNWHLLSVNTNLRKKYMNSPRKAQCRKKDSVVFQKRFATDLNCLEKTAISNPFMLEELTVLNNHDKAKFDNSISEDIKIFETDGEKQFLYF